MRFWKQPFWKQPFWDIPKVMRRYPHIGSFIAGCVASLCLPPLGLIFTIFALSFPALKAVQAPNAFRAASIWMAAGLGWFVFSTYWISHSLFVADPRLWIAMPFVVFGLAAVLASFWAVAGWAAWRCGHTAQGRLIWLVAMLGVAEFARGFVATGFPWNAPGYLFSFDLGALQAASWFGIYGLNIIALLFAFSLALWRVAARQIALVLLIVPLLLSLLGIVRIDYLQDVVTPDSSPSVRIVQPSVMQQEKWQRSRRPAHLQRLVDLSTQKVPVPRLVIWPETAFAGFASQEQNLLRQTVASATPFDGYLLTGIPRLDDQDRLFNAAVLHSHDGALKAVYDKRHLVPFGEYVPFRSLLPFIDVIAGPRDFSAGTTNKLFDVPDVGKAQILICYEVIFSGTVIDRNNKPDFIVNLTNDGWFGHTAGPWQHLAQSQMRAVEEGMTMFRAANAGISGAFDPLGRPLGQIGLGIADSIDVKAVAPLASTLFAKMGHLLFFCLLFLNAGFAHWLDRRLDPRR